MDGEKLYMEESPEGSSFWRLACGSAEYGLAARVK
jgi:hypothetical protein